MHMLHCSRPQRKSPEGLRIGGEYLHLLYVHTFCIDEDPSAFLLGGYRVSCKHSVEGSVIGKTPLT